MVSCNNSSNCHHQSQQPSPPPQQQQNGSSIYGIVNGSGCSTSGNYTVTLDDNLPSVGVSDNTSIPDTVSNPTFDCSHHTPVIVARSASSSSTLSSLLATTTIRDARTGIHIQHQYHSSSGKSLIRRGAIYGGSTITALPPHISCNSTTTGYHHSSNVTATPVVQSSSTSSFVCPSNFLQPYYSLSPSLSEFNVLQMCCQPLFTEIASQGTDISPSAESLYGFASRLHPITQTGKYT
ncbi:unnamed protein product [Thelazia callipaeda]|uniref:Uncharacterized protein n=1 Tax=Thelazia callipaeda TaxID=103827 RepID=A0A0N5DBK6_THECL|nr:unnamed protein product [Thelazia callipaeda]